MVDVTDDVVEQVKSANKAEDLYDSVQQAIELEFATIPVYLTAMLSLRPDTNRQIWDILHSVVIDEMLHFAIDCNLLIALGSWPDIANENFIPKYPSPLPMSIGWTFPDLDLTGSGLPGAASTGSGLIVGCESFSYTLVKETFMGIEKPDFPPVKVPTRPHVTELRRTTFQTIGDFYNALVSKIEELGDPLFEAPRPGKQLVADRWFDSDHLFAIVNAETAVRALQLIVREGEGTSTSINGDPDGGIAHYYRFQQILERRQLVKDRENRYAYAGADIPFDPEGVWNITPNQKLEDLDSESQAGRRAHQFAYSFTKLLKALHRTFNGEPGFFDTAMALMFELKLAGQALCSVPAEFGGKPTGCNVGPVFQYVEQNK
jgi:Ferritin-like